MNKKWNFLNSDQVYIYPSANADDQGRTNSEKNIANITDKLICKGFVVRKSKDDCPLHAILVGDNAVSVTNGSAVLEGYYLNFSAESGFVINSERVTSYHIPLGTLDKFLEKFKTTYSILYNNDGTPKNVSKEVAKENPLPMIHLVYKLLKNGTGNVRGDLVQVSGDGVKSITCKGTAWSFATDDELAEMTVPYLDIALIEIKPESTNTNILINKVINPPSKYAYIHEGSIVTEEGDTIKIWVENLLKQELGRLDTLTQVEVDEDTQVEEKKMTLSIKDGEVKVTRYVTNEGQFDENGNHSVSPDTRIDKSYSIDEIAQRTHPASSTNVSSQENSIASQLSDKDNGQGYTKVDDTDEGTDNGSSNLLARADHTHDKRYLHKREGDDEQVVRTPFRITKSLIVEKALEVLDKITCKSIEVAEKITAAGDITTQSSLFAGAYKLTSSGDLLTRRISSDGDNTSIEGLLNVNVESGQKAIDTKGEIHAGRVYGAVWNDYAELYAKDRYGEVIEPGTIVCKVPGRYAYTTSSYYNARLVVGVCSDSYGHLIGGDADVSLEENLKRYTPIALSGRVHVKVVPGRKVEEGDLIAVDPSCPGRGRPVGFCNTSAKGTIVGKALESSDGTKDKVLIQVFLG